MLERDGDSYLALITNIIIFLCIPTIYDKNKRLLALAPGIIETYLLYERNTE